MIRLIGLILFGSHKMQKPYKIEQKFSLLWVNAHLEIKWVMKWMNSQKLVNHSSLFGNKNSKIAIKSENVRIQKFNWSNKYQILYFGKINNLLFLEIIIDQ